MTMPSPVPTLCSRKSPNGWNVLSPRAGGIVNVPPLIGLPAAAVVRVRTWQTVHPILSNRVEPSRAWRVRASSVSRAGALVARMKRVKRSMSSSPVESGVLFGSGAVLHRVVTSSGNNRLVIPISFK